MRVITFKAEEELVELMDKAAIKLGITRSEVIRAAIKEYCRRLMGNEGYD